MKKRNYHKKRLLELFEKKFRQDEARLQRDLFNEFKKQSQTKRSASKQTKKSERPSKNKSGNTWLAKRKRTKVKTFPKKHFRNIFFFSNKKQFILEKPIKIASDQDLELLFLKLMELVPKIYSFFLNELKYKRTKQRIMNIGYQIVLRFSDRAKKDMNTIITTSYLPTLKINSKADIEKAMMDIIRRIMDRFEEYMNTGGFYSLEFYGVECEIEA